MVKGVSRQVIVVQSPDREHFEQAIFILKEGQTPVTDEVLLREAKRLLTTGSTNTEKYSFFQGLVCAVCGALTTGLIWLLSGEL